MQGAGALSAAAVAQVQQHAGRNRRITVGDCTLAYDLQSGTTRPFVFFLPGLAKSRYNTKLVEVEMYCRATSQGVLCADYVGTGRSSGNFAESGTISLWAEHAVALLDEVLGRCGRVILVGEGVGGWIALLATLKRPNRVCGIIGLAADPDFTEDIVWDSLSDEQRQRLRDEGSIMLRHGFKEYPISHKLIEDGRQHMLLRGAPDSLPIDVPVRLVHGLRDEEVPPQRALQLANVLRSQDVTVTFVKYGDHTLEEEEDFQRTNDLIAELSGKYFEYDLTSPQSG